MRLLLLGVGGMAGHTAALRLAELGHSVTGFARRKVPFCETIVADVHDIEKQVSLTHFDAVINCVGALVKPCQENPADAIWLNSYLPHLLAALTKESETKIIHISTDCVFSGSGAGGYDETGLPDATYLYGRSKALGELNDDKNLTLRMSIIGPDINVKGVGLFNWFMSQNGRVSGYESAIWTGVTTLVLADAIDAALTQDLSGLYHLVNGKTISKFELLKLFNTLRCDPVEIVPSDAVHENKSLVNMRADFEFKVPEYAEMVCDLGDWIAQYRTFYPHYALKGGAE